MADPFKGLKSAESKKTTDVHPLADYDGFEAVSKLLFGIGNLKGDGYDQPPRNMTLFCEGDHLKVVFGCGDDHAKLYTTVQGLSKLLEQVEEQIETSAFSWKEPRPLEKRTWRKS